MLGSGAALRIEYAHKAQDSVIRHAYLDRCDERTNKESSTIKRRRADTVEQQIYATMRIHASCAV